MTIRPVVAQMIHTNGWTAMTKLIDAFRNFAKNAYKLKEGENRAEDNDRNSLLYFNQYLPTASY